MKNISHIPLEEKVVAKEKIGPRRSRKGRPEQKFVSWMKDLVTKFCRAGKIVLDPCAATFATAKACMMVSKQGRFVGCEVDAARFDAWMPSVVKNFARQVLNEESDIVV